MHPRTPDTAGLLPLVKRRWRAMALTAAVVMVGGGLLTAALPKTYEASAKVLVMRTEQRMGGLRVVQDSIPELTGASHPLYTQVELLRVGPVLAAVVAALDLRDARGERLSAEAFAMRLRVAPVPKTDMIEIRYRDRDPALAQRVVTTLCETYLRHTEQQRRTGVEEGLGYVDEQLAGARKRLEDAEARLLSFKRRAGSLEMTSEIQASIGALSSLNSTIRGLQIDLASATARASGLRSQLGMSAEQAMKAASAAQSPRLRALREQLVEAETAPLRSAGLGAAHPEVAALDQRIAMLKREIAAEAARIGSGKAAPLDELRTGLAQQLLAAETEVSALKSSLAAAQSRRGALVSASRRLPGDEMALGRLTREVQVASGLYQQLLEKREVARLQMAIAPTYAQVIEPAAVPSAPLAPLKGPTLPMLAFLGLASAFGVGAVKDLVAGRQNPESLALALPSMRIFAALPSLSRHELRLGERVVETGTSPHYIEAVRALALAVEEQTLGPKGVALGLTSLTDREGKSVTTANLALCLVEAGHRVLLVDGDFRRGRVHELFGGASREAGLAEVVAGRAAPQAVVRHHRGLAYVGAGGDRQPSLARLKRHLAPAIEAWQAEYDFVLLDLPPILLMAEVAAFARATQGLLVVAKLQRVGADALISGVQQLQALRVPVLGVAAISQMVAQGGGGYYLIPGEEEAAS